MVVALSDLSVPSQGTQPVYVPNERGVLMRASELVYNDAPWIAGDGAWCEGNKQGFATQ